MSGVKFKEPRNFRQLEFTRRRFLKLVGLAGGGLAIGTHLNAFGETATIVGSAERANKRGRFRAYILWRS